MITSGLQMRVAALLVPLLLLAFAARADDFDVCNHSSTDPDAGIPACTRLIAREGESANAPGLYSNRGIGKVRIGDLAGAIEDFNSALNRDPKFVDAYRNRGIARQLTGDFDRAIADFNQALRYDPKSAALYNARGTALFSKDEYDRAIVDFNSALAIDSGFVKAYINRGLAQMYRRRLDQAIADFNEVVRLQPNEIPGYLNRATAKIDQGNLDGAIADLSEAIRINPTSSAGYTRRGDAWRLKGDFAKAMEDHDQAIKLERTAEAFNNRALVWKDEHDLEHALADLDEAILIDPKFFLAFANRGDILRVQGKREQALVNLDKAVSLNPKSPIPLTFRADCYRDRGELQRALTDYNAAIRNVPDFVGAFVGRGLTYERLGNTANAKLDFQKALTLSADADVSLAKPARELAKLRLAQITDNEVAKAKVAADAAKGKVAAIAAETAEAGKAVQLASQERVRADEEAKQKIQADARAKKELEAHINSEVEKRTSAAVAEAQARMEAEAAVRAAAGARELAEAEAKARAEAETKAKSEFEQRLRAEIQARDEATALEAKRKQVADEARRSKELGVRVALVIGNSAYQEAPLLPNPQRDSQAVAEVFKKLGFQTVVSGRNLRHDELLSKLREFDDLAAAADWAVIFYAGHGLEMDSVNYLLPIDAQLLSDRDVEDEAISLDRMLRATERAKKLRLVILDSCRDNPFLVKMHRKVASRSIGRGLAKIEPEGGTLVVYAARDGQTAGDGDGDHSPFTTAFLKNVVDPNLEINLLFRRVRDEVFRETQHRQEPFTYGSLPGDSFYFAVR